MNEYFVKSNPHKYEDNLLLNTGSAKKRAETKIYKTSANETTDENVMEETVEEEPNISGNLENIQLRRNYIVLFRAKETLK